MKVYFIYQSDTDSLLNSGKKKFAGYQSRAKAESVLRFQIEHGYKNSGWTEGDFDILEVDLGSRTVVELEHSNFLRVPTLIQKKPLRKEYER